MIIFGAGIAGCLAGIINPKAQIIERGSGKSSHKAVLRFRTNDISKVTGIPFKKVSVKKTIWYEDVEHNIITPRLAALYGKKVIGRHWPKLLLRTRTSGRLWPLRFNTMI